VVDPVFKNYYEKCKSRTMLSTEALYDLWWTVKYLCYNDMRGDIVEFGVWQGGALELVAHALNEFKGNNRIIGFDTFEGHPMPASAEVDIWGNNMQDKFNEVAKTGGKWAFADFHTVKSNLEGIYSNVKLIKGIVDENLGVSDINEVSILRLDMDWYEPTKAALSKLYGKIQSGGALIIDDYGHHSGAKKATDEYVTKEKLKINFRHINYSCVAANIL
jgi:O-methyltransferase